MEVREFASLAQENNHILLPIVKIETEHGILCPNPKCQQRAQLTLLTAHDSILYKIDCSECNLHTFERVPVNIKQNYIFFRREFIDKLFAGFDVVTGDNTLYKKVIHYGGFEFFNEEEQKEIKTILEKNLMRKECRW